MFPGTSVDELLLNGEVPDLLEPDFVAGVFLSQPTRVAYARKSFYYFGALRLTCVITVLLDHVSWSQSGEASIQLQSQLQIPGTYRNRVKLYNQQAAIYRVLWKEK